MYIGMYVCMYPMENVISACMYLFILLPMLLMNNKYVCMYVCMYVCIQDEKDQRLQLEQAQMRQKEKVLQINP